MSHTTVFIIMDAGRPQQLNDDTMPFMHALANQATTASFDAVPAHARPAAMFCGQHPDTSGAHSPYAYDPTASPFAWLRRTGPLIGLVGSRRSTSPTRTAIARTTKWLTHAPRTDPAAIPLRFLPYFRPVHLGPCHEPGALGAPSIFDLCRDAQLRFRYRDASTNGNTDNAAELVRELRNGTPHDLHVDHLAAPLTDRDRGTGHRVSDEDQLLDLDAKVASVHAALNAAYESWNLVICGQAGTTTPQRRIDLLSTLNDIDAVPGKDHVVFVHRTFAVFWYLTPKGRREVETALPHIQGTRVLDDDERRRHRLPAEGTWGDRLLATDSGVVFSPDFLHGAHGGASALHPHIGPAGASAGFAIAASNHGCTPPSDAGPRPLVDMFPTLCELVGVPVPSDQEGTSLLPPLGATPIIPQHRGPA